MTKTQCQVPAQINATLTDEQRESLRASLSGGAGGPLVHPPQPTLTDAEREALNRGIDALYGVEDVSDGACRRDDAAARTLLALQERLK